MSVVLPYRIAVLCYLFDQQGRTLLLHRRRPPNQDLYSPIGGKLDRDHGESPTACAIREIHEETGLRIELSALHLTGVVTETSFEDAGHWMMFLYEVTRPVQLVPVKFEEGSLDWHAVRALETLPIPDTDRRVIWPLFRRYRRRFFTAHLQCGGGRVRWRIEQPAADTGDWSSEPAQF